LKVQTSESLNALVHKPHGKENIVITRDSSHDSCLTFTLSTATMEVLWNRLTKKKVEYLDLHIS